MAITQDELQSIVNAVLSANRTNSRTIEQLTPVTSLSDDDSFEINGGKRVPYKILLNEICDTGFISKIPIANAFAAGLMSTEHHKQLQWLVQRKDVYLTIDHSDRLVVHGAEQYMAKGLEPVVFRCLKRSNRRTKMSAGNSWVRNGRGPTERRWTVFSHSSDAVKVDAGGVLSFCTTLFDGAEETPDNPLEYSNAAATLLLHPHLRSIFYGREFFGLDDVEALRMLKFPFVLAFIPHTQFGPAAPRITLDDAEAAVPFFVRYTPCFEYDTPGRYMTASHRFRFSLK